MKKRKRKFRGVGMFNKRVLGLLLLCCESAALSISDEVSSFRGCDCQVNQCRDNVVPPPAAEVNPHRASAHQGSG